MRLDYRNGSSGALVKLDEYERVPAAFGFWPLRVTPALLQGAAAANLSLSLVYAPRGSAEKLRSATLPLVVAAPALDRSSAPTPRATTLAIALPLVAAAVVVLVGGVCLWNRKARRIDLGNVMGRARHGARRARPRRDKHRDAAIPLAPAAADARFRDDADDDLGSLAGSPVEPAFAPRGHNVFRDELARQDRQRRADDGP